MTAKQKLTNCLDKLPDEKLQELLAFAHFLLWQAEREEGKYFGQMQLAKAYGPGEPDYSLAEIKTKTP